MVIARVGSKISLRGNLESLPNISPEIAGLAELNHFHTYSLHFIISDLPEPAILVSPSPSALTSFLSCLHSLVWFLW